MEDKKNEKLEEKLNEENPSNDWRNDFFLSRYSENLNSTSVFHYVDSMLGGKTRLGKLPIDLEDYESATLKNLIDALIISLDQDDTNSFVGSFTHVPKHIVCHFERNNNHYKLVEDYFNEFFELYIECSKKIKDYSGVGMGHGALGNLENSKKYFLKHDELLEQQDIIRNKLKSDPVNEELKEEYQSLFPNEYEIEKAREILKEYVHKCKDYPWYDFDTEKYLAGQKTQWDKVNGR
jgi:hypothetical protein